MKILLAEDTRDLNRAISFLLEHENYQVDKAFDGEEALEYLRKDSYDGIILDIMMPKVDGLTVLRDLRGRHIMTPVLLLTAKAEIEDRIAGLDAGADDYLPKPFDTGELIARIKALGRRSENYSDSEKKAGNLILDGNRYEMRVGTASVNLTNKEFQLMELFIQHPGYVFSADHLMEKIYSQQ